MQILKPIFSKYLLYSMALLPTLVLVCAIAFIKIYYIEKVDAYFDAQYESIVNGYVEPKKATAEAWIQEQTALFDTKYKNIERDIVKELQEKIYLAHNNATLIYKTNRGKKSDKEIKEQMKTMFKKLSYGGEENFIFINDYYGNSVLSSSKELGKKYTPEYLDADYRAIVLEAMQKARKRSEGFIKSNVEVGQEILFVKDLNFYEWIIGSTLHIASQSEYIKPKLLAELTKVSPAKNSFMALYEDKKALFSSADIKMDENAFKTIGTELSKDSTWHVQKDGNYHYLSQYYAPLNWHVVYGFDMSGMDANALQREKELGQMAKSELDLLLNILILVTLVVAALSFVWWIHLKRVLKSCQNDINSKVNEIKELSKAINYLEQSEMQISVSEIFIEEN